MKNSLALLTLAALPMSLLADVVIPQPLVDAERDGYLTVIDTREVREVAGMTAIMTQAADGKYRVYWSNLDEGFISTGDIITKDGFALTSKYMNLLQPPLNDVFDPIFENGIVLGSKDKTQSVDSNSTLYVFYEPFCGYCKKFHANLKPYIEQGLDVKVLPVAWISPKSPDHIATIAAREDFEQALTESDQQSLQLTHKADADLMERIGANRQIMSGLGITGTPGVVYKDSEGRLQITGGLSGEALENLVKPLMARAK